MEDPGSGVLWGILTIAGPIILGVLLYYYGARLPPLSRRRREAADRAARENWGKEDVR
jgi:hypothetical protein